MSPNSQNPAPKRPRWKIVLPLLVAGVGLALWTTRNPSRALAEKTRHELRSQGFKLDLAQFDFSVPGGFHPHIESPQRAPIQFRSRLPNRDYGLMRPVNKTAAMVLWKEDKLWSDRSEDLWPEIQDDLEQQNPILDLACQELSAGPFGFEPMVGPGGELLLPHLSHLRFLASALANRCVLDLHQANTRRAYTNLLTLARIISSWRTEPFELAWLVKFRCLATAQRALWQALQADSWTEAELLTLQREWSQPDFFSSLPETAALARVESLALCERARAAPRTPGPSLRQIGSDLLGSPDRLWANLTSGMRQSRYRTHGSYEDEVAIMLCFRQRELDLRRAISAPTWLEMRKLPGATNLATLQGDSTVAAIVNNRPANFTTPRGGGTTLLSRAAEAEARRRLSVCALALKRYHLAHGNYPASLDQLVPDYLKAEPRDFVDGQPLRYRLLDTHSFQLYSIGINGLDEQGQLPTDAQASARGGFGQLEEPDLVWPRAASPTEVALARSESESRRQRYESTRTSNQTFDTWPSSRGQSVTNTPSPSIAPLVDDRPRSLR
jgi:hypothetical protein